GRDSANSSAFNPAGAVRKAKVFLAQQIADEVPRGAPDPKMLVEIEVDSLDQLREVVPEQPDIVLLDNMTPKMLSEPVSIRNALQKVLPTAKESPRGANLKRIAPDNMPRLVFAFVLPAHVD